MKYVLNDIQIGQQGFTFSEFLVALTIKLGANVNDILKKLVKKEIIKYDEAANKYLIYSDWAKKVDLALLNADKTVPSEAALIQLTVKLMELFPKGKKEGTNQYWRGNKKDIATKLRKFFKLYGNYTEEDVYNATKRYVESFNGNYAYMRILKYFIFKSVRKTNEDGVGYIEDVSQLAEYLENLDNDVDNINSTEWNNEILN